jgi:ubiquinone/menaquinone biosynthesis C-methylase UbiE
MLSQSARKAKAFKGVGMEGPIASWYARNTASAVPDMRRTAGEIAARLDAGDWVLEVAPGPGYLAIELARLGLSVSAIDISRSFVRIGAENAARAGVKVDFRQGDAAALPFDDARFDAVVCRAAFKNFADPQGAINEMRRVLRPGGQALLLDMRRDATDAGIDDEVVKLRLGPVGAFMTRGALRSLRKRAYSQAEFERMIAAAGFAEAKINAGAIGFEITMTR